MRIPARCNRRTCQARRNLSKRPELYKYWPTCRKTGCDGKMYVDEYRLKKLEVKQRAVCFDDCYHYPHRIDSPNCKKREDYIGKRNASPRSKHSPIPIDEWVPF